MYLYMKVNLQNYKICSIQSRLSNSQIHFVRGDKSCFTMHSFCTVVLATSPRALGPRLSWSCY